MRSRSNRWLRGLALAVSLLAAAPAQAAWSGECEPSPAQPQLASIGGAVDEAVRKLPPKTVAEELAGKKIVRSIRIDVPALEQQGSLCGYYAAMMVLKTYNPFLSRDKASRLAKSMFLEAKERKLTTDGFISTRDLASLVDASGYSTRVKGKSTVDDLESSLKRGHPPIVLFVVEKDEKSENYGGPAASEPKGKNHGHFAVIEGIYTDDAGKRWIVAQHGWRAEPYVWSEDAFVKSWGLRGGEMLEIGDVKNDNRRSSR